MPLLAPVMMITLGDAMLGGCAEALLLCVATNESGERAKSAVR